MTEEEEYIIHKSKRFLTRKTLPIVLQEQYPYIESIADPVNGDRDFLILYAPSADGNKMCKISIPIRCDFLSYEEYDTEINNARRSKR